MSKNKQLVSVYGTLRKGCSNHGYICNGEYMGSFESKPIFSMYSVSNIYPALKLGGTTSVKLEVYEVDDEVLKKLDGLEGYIPEGKHNLYDRKKIFTPYGESLIYIYNHGTNDLQKVTSGDWKEFESTNKIKELLN